MNDVIATTILVHAGARVEFRRIYVGSFALRRLAHDYLPAFLGRAHLDPINIFAVEARLAKTNRLAHDQIRGDRRFPRTVGGGFDLRHRLFSRWIDWKTEDGLSLEIEKVQRVSANRGRVRFGC